ncbi:putative glycosyl transferase, group I [Klebsiella michiganensis]|nr:putative glycosyl transferase, group I [Klebsiella michiganensis]
MRIDDVEHYLSGFIAYQKYHLAAKKPLLPQDEAPPSNNAIPVFLLEDAARRPANGIEVAAMRRAKLFYRTFAHRALDSYRDVESRIVQSGAGAESTRRAARRGAGL